ncbi:MAG: hypothetical protein WCP10_13505 [Desulfuromonadales bacterium]
MIALLFIFEPFLATADFYRYVDKSGVTNLTNDYSTVPSQYRSRVQTIKESEPQKKPASQNKSAASQPTTSAPIHVASSTAFSPTEWAKNHRPLFKHLGIIALLIISSMFAIKMLSNLLPKGLAIVLRITIFCIIGVYIFKAFSTQITGMFVKLKGDTQGIQRAVDTRVDKIDKQVAGQ